MKTAYTIKGFKIMRMFKKGEFDIWLYVNRIDSLEIDSKLSLANAQGKYNDVIGDFSV